MDNELILDLLNDLTDLADDAEEYRPTQEQLVRSIRKIRDGVADNLLAEASESFVGACPTCHCTDDEPQG